MKQAIVAGLMAAVSALAGCSSAERVEVPRDSPAQAWVVLFDGTSLNAFRGYKQEAMPAKGWEIADGCLHRPAGEGGGDIVTREQYKDFEFRCMWKIAKGGNSGIIYRATEDHTFPWETGFEMQILDDVAHRDGSKPRTRAGSLYDLFPCDEDVVKPAGEWNEARIVARGTHIEHWLNGVKVVDVNTQSREFKDAWKASKWPGMPDFGTRLRGHIALQDHGDEVWFKDIRVRSIE